ncbi:NAD(P)-dependent oxidoreductase [Streptomyces venezuelae]|uniref:NAD(P)-dependent oxidoreductase n=1 Tax=Streptomyces venezuelae TaxID=54571 RepID=UPI003331383C
MTTLTLLHPGAMGAPLASWAVANGHQVLWVADGRGPTTRERADRAGLCARPGLADALRASDIVLSVCPPHAAEDVARSVAELGYGGLYVEANAISPARLDAIRSLLGPNPVLDGAIIGPPPVDGKEARLYLSGPEEHQLLVRGVFEGTRVKVRDAGPRPGSASALKMAFGGYQKAARTLAAVAHALADDHGVGDLLADEARTMPGAILADRAYIPSVAARAWRWAPEMREVAETLQAADLPPQLARAAAEVMGRWDGDKDRGDLTPREALDHLHGTSTHGR